MDYEGRAAAEGMGLSDDRDFATSVAFCDDDFWTND